MIMSGNAGPSSGGVRERKRQETRQRITSAALSLFTAQGYEATTLDAIAAAAGISRRTFFHYFKSKDDILLSLQGSLGDRLVTALAGRQPDEPPLAAVRGALLRMVAPFPLNELIVLDRLMRSSEAVQARKQAGYIQDEATLLDALRQGWPDESETGLKLVAMLCIGIARQALDAWSREGGKRPLSELLDEGFDAMAAIYGR